MLDAYRQYSEGLDWQHIVFYACRAILHPKSAMWYLLASIIGAVIVTEIYLQKNWIIKWLIVSIIGYSIVLLCNNYFFLAEGTVIEKIIRFYIRIFESARNGLFLAPIFLGIGFILHNKKILSWIEKHGGVFIIGLMVGTILLLTEAYLIYPLSAIDDRGFFISQLLLLPCLACLCLSYDIHWRLPYRLLRRLSTSIFYTHATIRTIIKLSPLYNGNSIILFITTLFLSLGVALWTYHSKNKYVHVLLG